MASASNPSSAVQSNTHAISPFVEPAEVSQHIHEGETSSSGSDKLSTVDKKLFSICKVIETTRRDILAFRNELYASKNASLSYEQAYRDSRQRHEQCFEAYKQLRLQHDEALKDLASMTNNNWMLKNELQALQEKVTPQEEKTQKRKRRTVNLEKGDVKLRDKSGEAAELVHHLEQGNNKIGSMGETPTKDGKKKRGVHHTPQRVVRPTRNARKVIT